MVHRPQGYPQDLIIVDLWFSPLLPHLPKKTEKLTLLELCIKHFSWNFQSLEMTHVLHRTFFFRKIVHYYEKFEKCCYSFYKYAIICKPDFVLPIKVVLFFSRIRMWQKFYLSKNHIHFFFHWCILHKIFIFYF